MTGTPSSFTGYKADGGAFNTSFSSDNWAEQKGDDIEKHIFTKKFCTTTFKQISKKANGMGGVLTTIFSSILRFSDITLFDNDNIGRVAISFFIRAILGIMLIAPLIVLAISLIKRVGYLWIAIIGSPFIILLKAFGDDLGIKLDNELEIFNLEKVI